MHNAVAMPCPRFEKARNQPSATPGGTCYFFSRARKSNQKGALSFALRCRMKEGIKETLWKRQQMLSPLAELLCYSQRCCNTNIDLQLSARLHMAEWERNGLRLPT